MYYKFGGFTQRLAGAGVPAAYSAQIPGDNRTTWVYYHIEHFEKDKKGKASLTIKHSSSFSVYPGFKPVLSVESPAVIFDTPIKVASDSQNKVGGLVKNKVPELQKLFQRPDDIPVHLKRSVPDRLLYRTTMALTIGGAIYCLIALYMATSPKREK